MPCWCQLLEDPIDYGQNNGRSKHIAGEGLQHRFIDALERQPQLITAHRCAALVVRQAPIDVASAFVATQDAQAATTDRAACEPCQQIFRLKIANDRSDAKT